MSNSQVKGKKKYPYIKIEVYVNNYQQAEERREWCLEEDEWWDEEEEEELVDDGIDSNGEQEESRIFIHPGYPVIRLKPRWSTSTR